MIKKWEYENYTLEEIYQSIEPGAEKIDYRRVNITNGRENICLGLFLFKNHSETRSTLNKKQIDYSQYTPFYKELVVGLVEMCSFKNYSFETFDNSIINLRLFLRFSEGFDDFNIHNLASIIERYCEHLREQTRINNKDKSKGICTSTARGAQRILINIADNVLGDGHCSHIRPIKINLHQQVNTSVPSECDMAQHFTHYTFLFEQLADRIIDFRKFPWEISMYKKKYFVFPYKGKLVSLDEDLDKYRNNLGFNYETGELRSENELYDLIKGSSNLKEYEIWSKVRHRYSSTHERLRDANASILAGQRRTLVTIAMYSYFMHFLILTGMNDSVAATIKFNQVEILPGRRKFKNVKLRAGNKEVAFEIQTIFIKYFERFLKLRKLILKECDVTCEFLFFEIALKVKKLQIKNFTKSGSAALRVNGIDPFNSYLPKITSRGYRVAKGQWIAEKNGTEVASFALQQSVLTNIKSYNQASQEKTDDEMTTYYHHLNDEVLKSSKRLSKMKTETGGCIKPNSPSIATSTTTNFLPNCVTQEGCLFCDKYVVHPDEVDIRKLLSLQFLVYQYEPITDKKAFNSIFEELINRITEILKKITDSSKQAADLVADIKKDVFENENLSSYWAQKYEMLDELGVI